MTQKTQCQNAPHVDLPCTMMIVIVECVAAALMALQIRLCTGRGRKSMANISSSALRYHLAKCWPPCVT